MCGTHLVILLLVVSDYVSKLWRCLEDYWVHCLPLQKAQVVLSKKSLVWHLDAWSGCALDYATKHLWIEFYRRPGTRQDSRNCLFSQFSWCLNVFKPWSQRERICRLSQFSGQVQDSQCSPLASACEGKYRYCVAPCYCLTMSEALRELLCRSKEHHAGGSMFSQRVTTCLKLLVSVAVLRWAH